jgi:hypothetical protein
MMTKSIENVAVLETFLFTILSKLFINTGVAASRINVRKRGILVFRINNK